MSEIPEPIPQKPKSSEVPIFVPPLQVLPEVLFWLELEAQKEKLKHMLKDPKPPTPGPIIVQRVILEKELDRYLQKDWGFQAQLQSGNVLIVKALPTEKIIEDALVKAKNQALNE